MRRRTRVAIAAVPVVAALVMLAPGVLAGPDTSATVRFGNDDVGSPFPPITGHDQSGNGKFNFIPRSVTIAAGGSVTYEILVRFGFHEPKVYDAERTQTTSTSSCQSLRTSSSMRMRASSRPDHA